MAKLNGVTTVDMVGGEVTKISYGGAEYVKVRNVVEPIDGDIALNLKDSPSYTEGAYYELRGGLSYLGNYTTKSDDKDSPTNGKSGSNFEVFRKVDAAKPAIETRVDALESRVDALEAAPTEDLKAGDKVTVTGRSLFGSDHSGEVGTFQSIDEDGDYSVRFGSGAHRLYKRHQVVKVAEAAPPKYRTIKRHAKVGERILITRAEPISGQSYAIGDVFTVTKTDVAALGDVNVSEQTSFIDYEEYEVIVEETPAKPQEIEHKGAKYTLVDRIAQPGDVVVIGEGGDSPFFDVGRAYVISDKGTEGRTFAYGNDGDVYTLYNYGRTTENTLVYAPAAAELRVGDYVVPLPSADDRYGITNGDMTLGKVVRRWNSTLYNDIKIEIISHKDGNEGRTFDVQSQHFRKATDAEIAQATQPKAGDIVVITANTNGSRNAVGDIGKVGTYNASAGADVDVPGKATGNGNFTRYSEMRRATPAEVAEYKRAVDGKSVKVGDQVTAVKCSRGVHKEYVGFGAGGQGLVKVGSVGEVIEVTCGGVRVKFPQEAVNHKGDRYDRFFLKDGEYALAETPKEPKLKVGDYAKALRDSEFGDIQAGEVVKIEDVDYDPYDEYYAEASTVGEYCYFRPQDLELVAADDALFARLGRKPGEFKKGDIVRVIEAGTHSYSVGEVVEFTEKIGRQSKTRYINGKTPACPYVFTSEVELIAPVESRVDLP